MDSAVLMKIEFDGKCKLIRLNQSTTFNEILDQIMGMSPNLYSKTIRMSYSVGCIKKCCISSDSDLSVLLKYCQMSSEKFVQVSVDFLQSENYVVNLQLSHNCVVDSSSNLVIMDNMGASKDKISYAFNKDHDNDLSDKSIQIQDSSEFTGLRSIPNFDICPLENTKTYLSDHWVNLMKVGAVFTGGAPKFRVELIKYSTKLNFQYTYVKNCPRYIYVVCSNKNSSSCEWFVRGRRLPMNSEFILAKANLVHRCVGNLLNARKNRFGAKIIKDILIDNVKVDPNITGNKVLNHINHGYGFKVPYWKAWRGIEAARDDIFGSYEESYNQLIWDSDAVKRTNPGSIVDLEKNNITNNFERIFISFHACKEGFKSCRPMLFIDGTFLKGRSKGILLAATAKDGNNGLFPVAFAVVSAENRNNWTWFLTKLRDLIIHPKKVVYISDRNIGLMMAFYDVWNEPSHFYCMYHLISNLKGRYGGGWNTQHRENMADLFKQCAYAPNIRIFKEKLEIFKQVGGKIATTWLEDLSFERWVVSYSPHLKRYGEMTSIAAESFNSWIREARALPITHMIDSIRKEIARWFVERRESSNKWTGLLVPSKEALWNELANISASWSVALYPNRKFEVGSKNSVTVDLDYNICTCFEWQIKGFPCAHAVAVIKKHCSSIENRIEECFFTSIYKQCYKEDLIPVPQTEKFESSSISDSEKILPPVLNKQPGRPKQKRITSYGEFRKDKPTVCKRCGKKGRHHPLTCATVFGTDKTNSTE